MAKKSETTEKIDLFDLAMKIDAGEPVEVTMMGHDLTLRRNFTGNEVRDILDAHFNFGEETYYDQTKRILSLVALNTDEEIEEFSTAMVELRQLEFIRVLTEIGKIIGLRGEGGAFLAP